MITITKLQNTFYLKAFSLDSSEFTKYVAQCRKKLFKYVEKKGYTTENPKLLLEFIDELGDDFDIFVSDKIRQEIEDYNPYIPSFKPRRLKFDPIFCFHNIIVIPIAITNNVKTAYIIL